jgi:pimeloyl-ACP methyl ester carboxylesterase
MLPVRWPLPPVRLRRRRRRHHRRRRPALELAGRLVRMAIAITYLLGATSSRAPTADPSALAQASPGTHVPPVDAPIVDPFRPPAGPYAAGNRGIEYDTVPGMGVRASGDGTVAFAGAVGGSLHVTVRHGGGVRTSYSFLAGIDVVLGQQVRQGDRLGTAGERLHFGARLGDSYFDPASLFGGTVTELELLPLEVPPGDAPDAEARALAQTALAGGRDWSLPPLDRTLAWLRDRAASALTYADQLDPGTPELGLIAELAERLLAPGPCSGDPAPIRPAAGQPRVPIMVAGLGSTSDSATIDALRLDELGYEARRAVRFSYAGGHTPSTGAALAGVAAHDYTSVDTQGDITAAARRLADLVEAVLAHDPNAVVDVFAHSLGGLVARLALLEMADRGVDLGRLGVVITLGAPHRGADLATAVAAASSRPGAGSVLERAAAALDIGVDPAAPVVSQLAERSEVVERLATGGLPPGVRLVSLAARSDLVAAAPSTQVAGAVNVTVPVTGWHAHSELVTSDAATEEMARALAGRPPACEPWTDAVADVVVGHGISIVEDHIAAAALGVGW